LGLDFLWYFLQAFKPTKHLNIVFRHSRVGGNPVKRQFAVSGLHAKSNAIAFERLIKIIERNKVPSWQ
jgi:hypothetical protein